MRSLQRAVARVAVTRELQIIVGQALLAAYYIYYHVKFEPSTCMSIFDADESRRLTLKRLEMQPRSFDVMRPINFLVPERISSAAYTTG